MDNKTTDELIKSLVKSLSQYFTVDPTSRRNCGMGYTISQIYKDLVNKNTITLQRC